MSIKNTHKTTALATLQGGILHVAHLQAGIQLQKSVTPAPIYLPLSLNLPVMVMC